MHLLPKVACHSSIELFFRPPDRYHPGRMPFPIRSPRGRDIPKSTPSSMVYGTAPGPLSPISGVFSSHDKPSVVKRPLSLESSSRQIFVGIVQHFSMSLL